MIHARQDYQHIQDEHGRIGHDEPVILFRAQDQHFIPILVEYANRIRQSAHPDKNILEALELHITRAADWQRRNKTKPPDMHRMDVRPPECDPRIVGDYEKG